MLITDIWNKCTLNITTSQDLKLSAWNCASYHINFGEGNKNSLQNFAL